VANFIEIYGECGGAWKKAKAEITQYVQSIFLNCLVSVQSFPLIYLVYSKDD